MVSYVVSLVRFNIHLSIDFTEKRKESILGMYDLEVPDVTAADGDSDTDIDESSQYQSPAKTQPKFDNDKKLDIFDMDTDEDEGANKSWTHKNLFFFTLSLYFCFC